MPWTQWKHDRIVDPRGYVLILVPGHHLADVRGYVYEHRLVAEQMLKRRLRPGEIVHHRDGDKGNNRRKNLKVCASRWHHLAEHRKPGSLLRMPDEANPLTVCACGCGTRFLKYGTKGRPRRYVSGHNARKVA